MLEEDILKLELLHQELEIEKEDFESIVRLVKQIPIVFNRVFNSFELYMIAEDALVNYDNSISDANEYLYSRKSIIDCVLIALNHFGYLEDIKNKELVRRALR